MDALEGVKVMLPKPTHHSFLRKLVRYTGAVRGYENLKKALEHGGAELVKKVEEADVLHIYDPSINDILNVRRARKAGVPVLIHIHAVPEELDRASLPLPKTIVQEAGETLLSILTRSADYLVIPSQFGVKVLTEYVPEVSGRVFALTNGVDLDKFRLVERDFTPRFLIGSLNRVEIKKGFLDFVEAAKLMEKDLFAWYGRLLVTAKHYPMLREAVKNRPANCFVFGLVQDAFEAYRVMNVFGGFSFIELEGMSLLEAGATGLPIVARDIPTFREKWRRSALFFKDLEEFAEKIEKLRNERFYRKMSRLARERVEKNFSIEALSSKVAELYSKIGVI